MSALVAFDSKDFKRSSKSGDLKFFTPLGCGIRITKKEEFESLYISTFENLLKKFDVSPVCACLASSEYFSRIGHAKTIKIADELLKVLQELIDKIYFSYVILPSDKFPNIEVGGYRSPKKDINTFDFLRQLSVYFSYITAWNYIGIDSRKSELLLIDGFNGKRTPAWDDLTTKVKPIVYPHGDECNVYIATADMVASLTDKKLWDNFMKLTPEAINQVWKDYSFKIETHFLDAKLLSKIKWTSDEQIDLTEYYAKPTIFLKADSYKTDDIKHLSVYPYATILARKLNGCVQGFDKTIDTPKIKDGDIFFYAGKEAETMASTLKDMYDIEIMPLKKLKEKINPL